MNKKLTLFCVLFFLPMGWLVTSCAYGATSTDKEIAFVKRFQSAVRHKNSHYVSQQLSYPIHMYLLKIKFLVGSAESAQETYSDWMNHYLYNFITRTPPKVLVGLLKIRKNKDGNYKIHHILFSGDLADSRFAKYGIDSAKALMHVITVLRKSAKSHCAECVAKIVEYPIWDCINGKLIKIKNKAQFVKYYEQIVTPEVKSLMLHAWRRHNWTGFPSKGIMLGPDGDIWIGSFGHKNAQGFWVWETKVWALREVGSCP